MNIKNRSYYFYNDLINVLNFEASNLELDKKHGKTLIFILLVTVKKTEWNVGSVNPLYLLINRVYGSISEKNGIKYLIIGKGDSALKKYDQVFSGIK